MFYAVAHSEERVTNQKGKILLRAAARSTSVLWGFFNPTRLDLQGS